MNLTKGQQAVLKAFAAFGDMDDVALSVYMHHVADVNMSSSGIRTRRCELVRKGLLNYVGTKRLKSGRKAKLYGLSNAGQKAYTKLWKARVI